MRCKKHPIDLSTSVGVCASCLRERLSALIATQTPPHAHPQVPSPAQPPPEKPYPEEFRHESLLRRVHSSTGSAALTKKPHRKFSLISRLFRSRSEKISSNCDDNASTEPDSVRTSSSSPSWFPFLPHRRRRRRREPSTLSSVEDSGEWKPFWIPDRGMSPARGPDCQDSSPSGSGCSSESSQGWRRTPASEPGPAAVARRTRQPGHSNNVFGMAFCLNPLVRASPIRHWKQKKGTNQETGFYREIRAPAKPHISEAASSNANRSRKLTDFSRGNKDH